jgi:hypothetical protein
VPPAIPDVAVTVVAVIAAGVTPPIVPLMLPTVIAIDAGMLKEPLEGVILSADWSRFIAI